MASFIDPAGAKAFEEAVVAIERTSSAEVVVAVRPHAHLWLVPAIAFGMLAAAAALAYTLFTAHLFPLWLVFTLPIAAGTAVALLVELPPMYRLLLPDAIRDEYVAQAARATFVDRGVHGTTGRTGLLVYISLLERRVMLVGDIAVERALGDPVLDRWERELSDLLGTGAPAVAGALAKHAGEIGKALPRGDRDINELPDAVSTEAT